MIQRKVIYEAPQDKFFKDVLDKKVADIMKENFENISPSSISDSEYSSWDSTADEIKRIIEKSELSDLYICFEYQVPYTRKRIDCILFGKNSGNRGVVVHIEMKQWQSIVPLETEGNFVETYVGGGNRKIPHPSQQVEGYHDYLINFVEVFEEEMELKGYAYCHNYKKKEGEGVVRTTIQKNTRRAPTLYQGRHFPPSRKTKGFVVGRQRIRNIQQVHEKPRATVKEINKAYFEHSGRKQERVQPTK